VRPVGPERTRFQPAVEAAQDRAHRVDGIQASDVDAGGQHVVSAALAAPRPAPKRAIGCKSGGETTSAA